MDVDVKLKGMHCSSHSPHRPTKKACIDLAAASALVLKEEQDPVYMSTHGPTEVSKLDPPAVKRPPTRYVDFGAAAYLMSNDTGGFVQKGDDRDEGDGITGEANAGLLNDDEVNEQEKNDSHFKAIRQRRAKKSFEERIEELKSFKEKHEHVRVTAKHDKSLYMFCSHVRCARRGKGRRTAITEDRIKALDELGFEWDDLRKSCQERIDELTRTRKVITEDRIKALTTWDLIHSRNT